MNNYGAREISEEVAAAVSAAVALMFARPGCNLVIRSIRRVAQTPPVWNSVGKIERLRRDLNS